VTDLVSRRNTLLAGLGATPAALAGQAPSAPQAAFVYDVKQFGASGRKSDKATRALQAAVDAAFAAGGGTVWVSPGEYTAGPVEIKSNVRIHVDAGATIYVSRDAADFPPRVAGVPRRRALFHGNNVRNIALTGAGCIDGQATWEWRLPPENDYTTRPIQEEVALARKAGLDMRFWHKTGPLANIVALNGAANVLIEGIRTVNSSEWCMRLAGCDGLFIRGVHLYSDLDRAVNSDGIDLVSCRNVVISDCILTTADDCISLKTPRNGGPIENVAITNCLLTSSSSAFVIGVETWHDIRHVILSNCVIRNSNRGLRIAVWNGCAVSDVIFSNLTMDLNRRHFNWWGNAEAFQFGIRQETAESQLGSIHNVTVENVVAHARGTSALLGPAGGKRIEDVAISNVRMFMQPENTADKRATHALHVECVRGFHLRDFSVRWEDVNPEPKWGSALYLNDVDDFDVEGFRGRHAHGGAAIVAENTTRGVIRNSRAADGCATFLEVRGERTKGLSVFANETSAAGRKLVVTGGADQGAVRLGEPA
jgi:hypothetical protein